MGSFLTTDVQEIYDLTVWQNEIMGHFFLWVVMPIIVVGIVLFALTKLFHDEKERDGNGNVVRRFTAKHECCCDKCTSEGGLFSSGFVLGMLID